MTVLIIGAGVTGSFDDARLEVAGAGAPVTARAPRYVGAALGAAGLRRQTKWVQRSPRVAGRWSGES